MALAVCAPPVGRGRDPPAPGRDSTGGPVLVLLPQAVVVTMLLDGTSKAGPAQPHRVEPSPVLLDAVQDPPSPLKLSSEETQGSSQTPALPGPPLRQRLPRRFTCCFQHSDA